MLCAAIGGARILFHHHFPVIKSILRFTFNDSLECIQESNSLSTIVFSIRSLANLVERIR